MTCPRASARPGGSDAVAAARRLRVDSEDVPGREDGRRIAFLVVFVTSMGGCSTHEEATKTCKESEVDAKCEICCAENGASGFTYYGRGRCTCVH